MEPKKKKKVVQNLIVVELDMNFFAVPRDFVWSQYTSAVN